MDTEQSPDTTIESATHRFEQTKQTLKDELGIQSDQEAKEVGEDFVADKTIATIDSAREDGIITPTERDGIDSTIAEVVVASQPDKDKAAKKLVVEQQTEPHSVSSPADGSVINTPLTRVIKRDPANEQLISDYANRHGSEQLPDGSPVAEFVDGTIEQVKERRKSIKDSIGGVAASAMEGIRGLPDKLAQMKHDGKIKKSIALIKKGKFDKLLVYDKAVLSDPEVAGALQQSVVNHFQVLMNDYAKKKEQGERYEYPSIGKEITGLCDKLHIPYDVVLNSQQIANLVVDQMEYRLSEHPRSLSTYNFILDDQTGRALHSSKSVDCIESALADRDININNLTIGLIDSTSFIGSDDANNLELLKRLGFNPASNVSLDFMLDKYGQQRKLYDLGEISPDIVSKLYRRRFDRMMTDYRKGQGNSLCDIDRTFEPRSDDPCAKYYRGNSYMRDIAMQSMRLHDLYNVDPNDLFNESKLPNETFFELSAKAPYSSDRLDDKDLLVRLVALSDTNDDTYKIVNDIEKRLGECRVGIHDFLESDDCRAIKQAFNGNIEQAVKGVENAYAEKMREGRHEIEMRLNKKLTSMTEIEKAFEGGDDRVEKSSVEFEGQEIPVYTLKGYPFRFLQHDVRFKQGGSEHDERGRLGSSMSHALEDNPSLWSRRRDELTRLGGKDADAESDTISMSYYSLDYSRKGASPIGLIYGFDHVFDDSLLHVYTGDGGTTNAQGNTEVSKVAEDKSKFDNLEAKTSGYNELLVRRYRKDGSSFSPRFLLCSVNADGSIEDVVKKHAAYFGVPIVRIDSNEYVERGKKIASDAVDRLMSDDTYNNYTEVYHLWDQIKRYSSGDNLDRISVVGQPDWAEYFDGSVKERCYSNQKQIIRGGEGQLNVQQLDYLTTQELNSRVEYIRSLLGERLDDIRHVAAQGVARTSISLGEGGFMGGDGDRTFKSKWADISIILGGVHVPLRVFQINDRTGYTI